MTVEVDRDSNDSWAVPDVLYNPQALNNFLPGSRKVWEPSPSAEPSWPVASRGLALPEAAGAGCPWGGGAAAGPPRDLLQQCLWAAGITEQLLEAEAKREPGSFQPPPQPAASRSGPQLCRAALGQQPALSAAQPFVQHLGPFASLWTGSGPAQLEGQQGTGTALPAPRVVFLQQVPQRIMLQVEQPAPTTLVLFPGPASCVLGSGQGPLWATGPQTQQPPTFCHPVVLRPPAPWSTSTPAQQHPNAQGCGN
ncbi:BRD4-interacting chromatin-remodeling complex-associated protein-like [Cyanocitta cristata]